MFGTTKTSAMTKMFEITKALRIDKHIRSGSFVNLSEAKGPSPAARDDGIVSY